MKILECIPPERAPIHLKDAMDTPPSFSAMFSMADIFLTSVYLSGRRSLPKMGSTLKEQNLLP